MLKILIGSKAIQANGVPLPRKPKDSDYLVKSEDFHKIRQEESIPVDLINGDGIMDSHPFNGEVATINELYTLKVSHSPWVIKGDLQNWYKHLYDIRLLKEYDGKLIQKLHDAAYKEWEKRLGIKKVNLNKDTEEFFDNNVKRKYVHDSVHESIAFYPEPLFNRILKVKNGVSVSEKLFDKLSFGDKVRLVQEEVMVLSLERDLIPHNEYVSEVDANLIHKSYAKQLSLLITKYSKNWFPRFIIENYFEVATPPYNYWECFMDSDKKILL